MVSGILIDIPQPLANAIERDEKLLWWDRPPEGLIFRQSDVFAIPFSAMWAGFTVFWEYQMVSNGAPSFFGLCGIPFILAGIYILIGRFFHDAWRRRGTVYGVTSQRAIIVACGETKSLELANLGEILLREADDGTGTISFGQEPSVLLRRDFRWSGKPAVPTFEKIKDVRRVLATIREAKKTARQTA